MQIALPATTTARTAGRRWAIGRGAALDGAIVVCLFALSLWRYLGEVDAPRSQLDEPRWIHRAFLLGELSDPLGPAWDEATYRDRPFPDERTILRHQPPLGYYLLGLGLLAQGRDLETHGFRTFFRNEEWNRQNGRMPAEADLFAARRTSAVFGALTVVALYAIGRRLGNRVAGVAGALVLLPHPLQVDLSSLALSDQSFALLVALTTLAAVVLAARPTWPRALLLGALVGLGGASKLSPLLLTVPLAAFGAVLLLCGGTVGPWRVPGFGIADLPRSRRLGAMLLSTPVVVAAVFVASYPYLWPDPIGRTRNLFEFRVQEMENQQLMSADWRVDDRVEAVRRVAANLGEDRTTTVWLADTLELERRFGIGWEGRGWELALGVLGGALLIVTAIRGGIAGPHALAAVVLGGQLAIIVAGLRVDFWRYYLPFVLAMALGIGLVAGAAWVRLRRAVGPAIAARADPARAPLSRTATGGPETAAPTEPGLRPQRKRRRRSKRGGPRATRSV